MIRIQSVTALWVKQCKDTVKNLPILVLFIVYPCIALVMTQAMKDQAGTQDLFLSIFATMHCVFTPIVSAATILSEEKEMNTLRVLLLSNVRLREYFLSIGGFILLADLLTGSSFLFIAGYSISGAILFLLAMGGGCLISILLGICIGLYAGNTAAANGLAVPFGMVFAFLPMLSSFNQSIKAAARFTYGQQISYLLSGTKLSVSGIIILIINIALLLVLSAVLYKRSLSED